MKILVFEYITGGGLNKQTLPDALLTEAVLMLRTLLNDLSVIPDINVDVMLDRRLPGQIKTNVSHTVLIHAHQDYRQELQRMANNFDAVWLIAPESDGLLQTLCELIESMDILLLTSPSKAVAVTGNKLKAYQRMQREGITTISTERLTDLTPRTGEWIIKPVDGAGGEHSYILTAPDHWRTLSKPVNYLIQPHMPGEKLSLSCLFKNGQAWLLSVNRQHFQIIDRQYHLQAITVNDKPTEPYQLLAKRVASAFPELTGYAGIDLIQTPKNCYVLEINPRLTTSYAGINQALGFNVARAVLQLAKGEMPAIERQHNKAVIINIHSDCYAD